jgi:signal transduction histidine kinase
MLTAFIRWFNAPIFPEDEEKTRKASLLNAILNTSIIATPAFFISIVLGGNTSRLERILIILACAWLMTFGSRLLMLSGRVAMAGIISVILTFAGVTLNVYNIGTIRTPATSVYILIIIIAGLAIHRRAVIWTAVFSAIAVITLWFWEKNGFLPTPNFYPSASITQAIAFTVILATTAVLFSLAIKSIDEALGRVRQELTERMLTKEREVNRRIMMEKVICIGKTVTEKTSDLRATLFKIWDSVRNGLEFDRTAIFLYNPNDNMMQGSFGTNRSGGMTEEWDMKFGINENNSFFKIVLSQPDGFYFTQDYAGERNLSLRPGHPMGGVKYYAAVAVWAGEKPLGIICVDQLVSGRAIADDQLEALRLFAGYAGLAIENARLNSELEGRMQERENFIQELGNRNAELERFTYTVSHDLRSPLVTIKGFLGMLDKDILKDQKDKIASDMQRIAGAADKMEVLLSDLLELSRIGRIIHPPEEIDLVKLAYETLETVDGRIRARNISTHIAPDLPHIHGDRARLGEVLENLLDNAAKYMGEQPNPFIEVGTRIDQVEYVIYVKDNGMGIEQQYLQKVFGLFEKLNPASEGTGIGLALIKRIIEVHGGRIWAESDGPGKGSTFCFTIPDKREQL